MNQEQVCAEREAFNRRFKRGVSKYSLELMWEAWLARATIDEGDAARYRRIRSAGYLMIADGSLLDEHELLFSGEALDRAVDSSMSAPADDGEGE